MRLSRRIKRAVPGGLRVYAKSMICRVLCDHQRLMSQDIFLHVSRRSGSTWLTEIISSEPDVRCVQDPLTPRNMLFAFQSLLKGTGDFYFPRVDPQNADQMLEYFQGILEGRLHVGTQWNPFSPLFHRKTCRTIVKLANAGGMAEWLASHFGGFNVLMIRHPIPTILSQEQWGMCPYTEFFRNDEWFFHEVLSSDQRRLVDQIIQSQDPQRMRMADWCMENVIPLRRIHPEKRLVVTYEELSANPMNVVRSVGSFLGLKSVEVMQSQSRKPSVTRSDNVISQGLSGQHWMKWLKTMDVAVSRRLMEICDIFGMGVYSWNSGSPREFLVCPESSVGSLNSVQ